MGEKNVYVLAQKNDKFQGHVFRVDINPGHMTYLGSGHNDDSV
jgi:hypothetical protein